MHFPLQVIRGDFVEYQQKHAMMPEYPAVFVSGRCRFADLRGSHRPHLVVEDGLSLSLSLSPMLLTRPCAFKETAQGPSGGLQVLTCVWLMAWLLTTALFLQGTCAFLQLVRIATVAVALETPPRG